MKYLSVFLLVLFTSCRADQEPTQTVAELIDQRITKRLDILKARKMKDCQEDLLINASEHVDRVIAEEFKLDFVDTIRFPTKPRRPNVPGGGVKLDTAAVLKIIEDLPMDTSLGFINDTLVSDTSLMDSIQSTPLDSIGPLK